MPDLLPEFTASANFSAAGGGPLVFAPVPAAGIGAAVTPFFKGDPGPRGPVGPVGSTAPPPIPFNFGDASPRTIFTTVDPRLVKSISVNIVTPFNGYMPQFNLGTPSAPDSLVPNERIDLSIAMEFEFSPNTVLNSAQGVVLTLAPGAGATQGAGWIVIEQLPST